MGQQETSLLAVAFAAANSLTSFLGLTTSI